MVAVEDVRAARDRVAGRVIDTPLSYSHSLSRLTGREVWLKAECLQRTGSFKIRGATNVLSQLGGRAVVAASAGNHAQGVALAAAWSGSPCTVFMPANAPLPKIEATRDYGADVRLVTGGLAEAVAAALADSEETGARFVHPYDDPLIIAGQGTLGLEVLATLPEVGTVVVPTGGGGLLSGVAVAVKSARPQSTVVGVEIAAAPTYLRSLEAGRPVEVPLAQTVADGINVQVPSPLVFDLLRAHVDLVVTVDDAQTASALSLVLERTKLMTEPAGVVGVAALLEGLLPSDAPDPVVVVLSGGNIDLLLVRKVVRHGLEVRGRYADVRVWVPDQPGQLAHILELIADLGANVLEVEHHREGFGLPWGLVEVNVSVETLGHEHRQRLLAALAPYLPSS